MDWEWDTSVTVTKEGDFARSGLESLHEIETFKGGENTLTMRQTYTNKFQCTFMLNRYPFDTQVTGPIFFPLKKIAFSQECTIEMVVGTLDLKTVSLRHDMLYLKQHKDMTLFQITHQELFYTNASNAEQGLRMLIVLKRKIMSEIMTTFFPSILLTLITFATTLFKEIYFEASLSVNLTTMLVMTTIFISKMEGLPPTSETKMIDMWLILCQLVPFIEVMLVTAIEFYKEDEKKEGDKEEPDMNMSMILADLYAVKMDKDIPVENTEAENSEMVEVSSGNALTQFWEDLCAKHQNEGIIVPHLHFIGKTGLALNDYYFCDISITEEIVVPGTVVFLAIIYFAVAASYYNN